MQPAAEPAPPGRSAWLGIGDFEFEPATGLLRRTDAGPATPPLRLAPQPAALLALLIERDGDIATRDEIRARIWPDVSVEFDASLHHCVRQVRTALGERASETSYIETIPRRGYRLQCAVRRPTPPAPEPVASRAAHAPAKDTAPIDPHTPATPAPPPGDPSTLARHTPQTSAAPLDPHTPAAPAPPPGDPSTLARHAPQTSAAPLDPRTPAAPAPPPGDPSTLARHTPQTRAAPLDPRAPAAVAPHPGAVAVDPPVLAAPVLAPSRSRRALLVGAATLVAAAAVVIATRAAGPPRIAILPFADPAMDEPTALAATRLGERVLAGLVTRLGTRCDVLGPRSTAPLLRADRPIRDIADELGAAHVINARWLPDRAAPEILVELIRTRDGRHVWVRDYPAAQWDGAVAEVVDGLATHLLAAD